MSIESLSYPAGSGFLDEASERTATIFRRMIFTLDTTARERGLPPLPAGFPRAVPKSSAGRCWLPELGAIRMALGRELTADGWEWMLGELHLAAYTAGLLQEIDLAIPGTHPLTFAGQCAAGARFHLRGHGDELELSIDGAQARRFTRSAPAAGCSSWIAAGESALRLGSASHAVLAGDAWMPHWLPEAERGEPAPPGGGEQRVFEEALALLERRAPAYHLWTTSLVREVMLIRDNPRGTINQSFVSYPGHIQGVARTHVQALVTALHEGSHQAFYVAAWCSPLVSAGAPAIYHAIKHKHRPLERVLAGFHAVGNILLGLERCAEELEDGGELRAQVDDHLRLLKSLDGQILEVGLPFLTPSGAALYQPLRRQLEQRDHLDRRENGSLAEG